MCNFLLLIPTLIFCSKKFFQENSGLSVTVFSGGEIEEPKIAGAKVLGFSVTFKSNRDLLVGVGLHGQLLTKPKPNEKESEAKKHFPLFLSRVAGR